MNKFTNVQKDGVSKMHNNKFVCLFLAFLLLGVVVSMSNDPYEAAVSELRLFVPVAECQIGDSEQGNVVGQTRFWSDGTVDVLIEEKDPFVVYHEEAHVFFPGCSEEFADNFAILRTGQFWHWKSAS